MRPQRRVMKPNIPQLRYTKHPASNLPLQTWGFKARKKPDPDYIHPKIKDLRGKQAKEENGEETDEYTGSGTNKGAGGEETANTGKKNLQPETDRNSRGASTTMVAKAKE